VIPPRGSGDSCGLPAITLSCEVAIVSIANLLLFSLHSCYRPNRLVEPQPNPRSRRDPPRDPPPRHSVPRHRSRTHEWGAVRSNAPALLAPRGRSRNRTAPRPFGSRADRRTPGVRQDDDRKAGRGQRRDARHRPVRPQRRGRRLWIPAPGRDSAPDRRVADRSRNLEPRAPRRRRAAGARPLHPHRFSRSTRRHHTPYRGRAHRPTAPAAHVALRVAALDGGGVAPPTPRGRSRPPLEGRAVRARDRRTGVRWGLARTPGIVGR